ncbi:MAG: hypothetical protein CMH52_06700 [Myxococcales bacterium]|nr:hypothetical protein [Myxococcales bacterium]
MRKSCVISTDARGVANVAVFPTGTVFTVRRPLEGVAAKSKLLTEVFVVLLFDGLARAEPAMAKLASNTIVNRIVTVLPLRHDRRR